MRVNTLAIIGVGLIGGSVGLAAKRRGLAGRVIGAGRQLTTLELAQSLGAIDEATLDQARAAAQADFVVYCTPVDGIAAQVLAAAPQCRPGTVLTDAGSTKAAIVRALDGQLPAGVAFVGAHPLAGSEKRGPEYAQPDLFEGRVTVVTPTAATDPAAVERVVQFWRTLGARVRCMDPEGHDRALAVTSHLPHLVAAALAGVLPPDLGGLTAGGFRDTTRIAAGDPALWTAIFAQNRPAMLNALDGFTAKLAEFHQALEAGDLVALDRLLTEAKRVRDALGS
jgi:prephenate dehydrogenase